MRTASTRIGVGLACVLGGCADEYCEVYGVCEGEFFSTQEWETIETLSPQGGGARFLGEPVEDNELTDDPAAIALGEEIFYDVNLGPHGASCATCHPPEQWFTSDLARRPAIGDSAAGEEFRGITSVIDSVYYSPHKWDGSKGDMQLLLQGAIENSKLVDGNRVAIALYVYDSEYKVEFEDVCKPKDPLLDALPIAEGKPKAPDAIDGAWELELEDGQRMAVDAVYDCVALAIDAYMRTLVSGASRFDDFVASRDPELLTESEKRGLRLFIGEAQCIECHSGPRFTDDAFHNIGLPTTPEESDWEKLEREEGTFRTPTLRNVTMTPPYMHTRHLATIEDVLWYYHAVEGPQVGELDPLVPEWEFTDDEVVDLAAFLATLTTTSCPWADGGICPPPPPMSNQPAPSSWPSG